MIDADTEFPTSWVEFRDAGDCFSRLYGPQIG